MWSPPNPSSSQTQGSTGPSRGPPVLSVLTSHTAAEHSSLPGSPDGLIMLLLPRAVKPSLPTLRGVHHHPRLPICCPSDWTGPSSSHLQPCLVLRPVWWTWSCAPRCPSRKEWGQQAALAGHSFQVGHEAVWVLAPHLLPPRCRDSHPALQRPSLSIGPPENSKWKLVNRYVDAWAGL